MRKLFIILLLTLVSFNGYEHYTPKDGDLMARALAVRYIKQPVY